MRCGWPPHEARRLLARAPHGHPPLRRDQPAEAETEEAPTFESLAERSGYEPTTRIAINAEFLLGIAEAFGVKTVILEMPPTQEETVLQALHVVPIEPDGSEAYLMPVQLPRRRE
jgi:hypothetical protein